MSHQVLILVVSNKSMKFKGLNSCQQMPRPTKIGPQPSENSKIHVPFLGGDAFYTMKKSIGMFVFGSIRLMDLSVSGLFKFSENGI